MNADKAFIDTNIFIYLYSDTEPEKKRTALSVIGKYDRIISTQVLNEFCNVCIRKLNLPIAGIKVALGEICSTCEIMPIDESFASTALDIREKYGYSYYDSLIITAALESGCTCLLTEDLANGQIIKDTLLIKNILV